ncbi:MAG: AAA family ATPase [bacterium]
MSKMIAVAGKGGTGKTTLCALLIKEFIAQGKKPILAVDADANANLHEALGIEMGESIGHLRERAQGEVASLPMGVTKDQYIEQRIHQSVVEGNGFDLITMGRPEGPGCYCYANHLIRRYVDKLNSSYQFVVMDNEAGMEHLSRRTTQDVDYLLVTTDPSVRGLHTVRRIRQLVDELKLNIKQIYTIVTRVNGKLGDDFLKRIEELKLEMIASVPSDEMVLEYDSMGKPLFDLPVGAKAVKAVRDIVGRIF